MGQSGELENVFSKEHRGGLPSTRKIWEGQGVFAREVLGMADLVLLTDVLEHVEKDAELLARIVRGMKPGGHLLLTVPACPLLWSPHDEVHGHFRRHTRVILSALLAGLSLQPLLLAPLNLRLCPMAVLRRESRPDAGEPAASA